MSRRNDAWVQRLHDKIVADAALAGGYSSMETAPRDGTHILIKCIVSLYDKRYGDYLPVGCKWEESRFVGDKFEVWTGADTGYQIGGGGEPIGWAPLPDTQAPEPRAVDLPEFDGYQAHIVRELQAAFVQACEKAGIKVGAL